MGGVKEGTGGDALGKCGGRKRCLTHWRNMAETQPVALWRGMMHQENVGEAWGGIKEGGRDALDRS